MPEPLRSLNAALKDKMLCVPNCIIPAVQENSQFYLTAALSYNGWEARAYQENLAKNHYVHVSDKPT